MDQPKLSILIVVHDMQREAPRTIASALPGYQRGIEASEYEVLVLENGSTRPLSREYRASLPDNVRVIDVPDATPSPGSALNWGVTRARGDALMLCIDGARLFSDRLIANSLRVITRFPSAFVYTLGWHLGPDLQMRSLRQGYDQREEDRLLDEADWYSHSDSLFDISVPAASTRNALTGPISESNAFTVGRALFEEVGGYDSRFQIPGGSTSNLEIFRRYVTRADALNVCLLSEGTFHQFHGGAATGNPEVIKPMFDEYAAIFGEPFARANYETLFFGWPRPAALRALAEGVGGDRV